MEDGMINKHIESKSKHYGIKLSITKVLTLMYWNPKCIWLYQDLLLHY